LRQLEDCTRGYDDDALSQLIYGFRQGQILRFELVLLAGMGNLFIDRHPWGNETWFHERNRRMLEIFGENKIEIAVTNTWHNRLIGDNLLPAEERITWTTAPFRLKDKPLLPAGIIGNVKIILFP